MTDATDLPVLAVLGGTGKEGKGLAYRWAKYGYQVIIGSRTPDKAQAVADELISILKKSARLSGCGNLEAAQMADVVVLTVPYAAHRTTLESVKEVLKGKILLDVTVPLVPPKVTQVQMPPAGSAAKEAREILGEDIEIAAAFHNISYEHLLSDQSIDCDVLVCGTSKSTRNEALKLVAASGLNGWDAGPIENAVVMEGLTSILIGINKQYNSTHAGIKITGVNR